MRLVAITLLITNIGVLKMSLNIFDRKNSSKLGNDISDKGFEEVKYKSRQFLAGG